MDKEIDTIQETTKNTRGWEALEVKLKAKGLSAGEIAHARKTFDDGIETLTKLFLATYSVEKFK